MLTRMLASTVAGGVTLFVLGFVIYALILDNTVIKPNMNPLPGLTNEEPVLAPLILANLVSAFLLTYIFDRWASISTFVGGLQGGAVVWFLISLSVQLMSVAFMNVYQNYIPAVADVVGSTVMGAIAGGVIGLVLGKMKKE